MRLGTAKGLAQGMLRWILIGLLSLLTVGCGDDSGDGAGSAESAQTGPEESAETQAASEAAEEAAAAAEAEEASRVRDLAGLSAVVNDDGTITLTGSDRWGGSLDATYADLEYLTNAIPVLERSVTDEQHAALEAFAQELGGGAGEAPEEGDTPEEPAGGE